MNSTIPRLFLCLLIFTCPAVGDEYDFVKKGSGIGSDDMIPFEDLPDMDADLALGYLKNIRVMSIGSTREEHQLRELRAYQMLARNPGLPFAVRSELERTPELVENPSGREKIIKGLERLPAEWSVRMLVNLSRRELVLESEKYDMNDPEVLGRVLSGDPHFDPVSNSIPGLAVSALKRMELPGWLDNLDEQVPMQLHPEPSTGFDPRNHIMRVAMWAELNEHRILEMVRRKWGELAIMNADIGLGTDNLPLAQDGSSPTRSRSSKRPLFSTDESPVDQEGNHGRLLVLLPLILLPTAGFVIWILRRRAGIDSGGIGGRSD